jgi:hypothetical protein
MGIDDVLSGRCGTPNLDVTVGWGLNLAMGASVEPHETRASSANTTSAGTQQRRVPLGESDKSCEEPVRLTIAEYEAIRREPTHFLVVPDDAHVVPDVEIVVERTDRYWVVEKMGHAATMSERFDPRSRHSPE